MEEYTAVLLTSVAAPLLPTSAARAGNIRKFDRMRFVECMVLDTVKPLPLYLKVNEVMTRYELDGRNHKMPTMIFMTRSVVNSTTAALFQCREVFLIYMKISLTVLSFPSQKIWSFLPTVPKAS